MCPGWMDAGRVITYDASAACFSFLLNRQLQDAPGCQRTCSLTSSGREERQLARGGSGDAGVLGAESWGPDGDPTDGAVPERPVCRMW